MILNTNSLPFPISPGFRAIILKHIADSFMACVLSFHHGHPSPGGDGGNRQVEIAVDTDGSLIYISDFCSRGIPPSRKPVIETRFDFSRNEVHFLDGVLPLNRERERFQAWEHAFVDNCRSGNYEVEVLPLLELEEIVAAK